ncbi:hypothetical protein SUGI_1017190 [Cryptomeria japonica]|nr:hypothetical protein SUGI_1017190 [Cryptomeria japonica]
MAVGHPLSSHCPRDAWGNEDVSFGGMCPSVTLLYISYRKVSKRRKMDLREFLGWSNGELMRSDAKPCSTMMRQTAGIFSVGGALAFWTLARVYYVHITFTACKSPETSLILCLTPFHLVIIHCTIGQKLQLTNQRFPETTAIMRERRENVGIGQNLKENTRPKTISKQSQMNNVKGLSKMYKLDEVEKLDTTTDSPSKIRHL